MGRPQKSYQLSATRALRKHNRAGELPTPLLPYLQLVKQKLVVQLPLTTFAPQDATDKLPVSQLLWELRTGFQLGLCESGLICLI